MITAYYSMDSQNTSFGLQNQDSRCFRGSKTEQDRFIQGFLRYRKVFFFFLSSSALRLAQTGNGDGARQCSTPGTRSPFDLTTRLKRFFGHRMHFYGRGAAEAIFSGVLLWARSWRLNYRGVLLWTPFFILAIKTLKFVLVGVSSSGNRISRFFGTQKIWNLSCPL